MKKNYREKLGLHCGRNLNFSHNLKKITHKVVYTSGVRDFGSQQISEWLTFSILFNLLSILVLLCTTFEPYIVVYFWPIILRKLVFFSFSPICAYNGRKSSIVVVIRFFALFVKFTMEYWPFFLQFSFFSISELSETFFRRFWPKFVSKSLSKKSEINQGKD